jgi:hypothetical protein
MLRSSWKRGVVRHGPGGEVTRIWRVVRVPRGVRREMVRPVAPLDWVVRSSKGEQVRCWRQVVGMSVWEPSP